MQNKTVIFVRKMIVIMESKPVLRFVLTRNECLRHYDEVSGPEKDYQEWEEPMPDKVDMGYDYVTFELLSEDTIRCAQYPGGGIPFWWKPDYVLLERGHSRWFQWTDTESDHDGMDRDGDRVTLEVFWPEA